MTHGVDTGFLVFNERTYPGLIGAADELQVPTAAPDMSFSVQVPGAGRWVRALEWSGSSLATVFAQRGATCCARAFGHVARAAAFNNRLCTALAESGGRAGAGPAAG